MLKTTCEWLSRWNNNHTSKMVACSGLCDQKPPESWAPYWGYSERGKGSWNPGEDWLLELTQRNCWGGTGIASGTSEGNTDVYPKETNAQEGYQQHQCWWHLLFKFIYLFLAVLGLHCCMRAFSSCSGCGAQTCLLSGIWGLPGPGIEPVSPALAARFLTSGPPGKSPFIEF